MNVNIGIEKEKKTNKSDATSYSKGSILISVTSTIRTENVAFAIRMDEKWVRLHPNTYMSQAIA